MPFGLGGGPWWAYNNWGRWGRYGWYWGRCFRFPWLPRWWWAYPDLWQDITPKEEKEMLKEELEALREEMKAIQERLKELETKKKK